MILNFSATHPARLEREKDRDVEDDGMSLEAFLELLEPEDED